MMVNKVKNVFRSLKKKIKNERERERESLVWVINWGIFVANTGYVFTSFIYCKFWNEECVMRSKSVYAEIFLHSIRTLILFTFLAKRPCHGFCWSQEVLSKDLSSESIWNSVLIGEWCFCKCVPSLPNQIDVVGFAGYHLILVSRFGLPYWMFYVFFAFINSGLFCFFFFFFFLL